MINTLFWLAIGWAIHPLLPIPYLDRAILDGYAKFWSYIKTKTSSAS